MKKTYEFITNKGMLVRLELDSKDLDHTKVYFDNHKIEGYAYSSAVDGLINVVTNEEFEIDGNRFKRVQFGVNNSTQKSFRELYTYLKVYEYRKENNSKGKEDYEYIVFGSELCMMNDPIYFSYDLNSSYRILDFELTSIFCRHCFGNNNLKGYVYFWEFYEVICNDKELINYAKENGEVNGRIVEATIPREIFESIVERVVKDNHERIVQIDYLKEL